MNIDRRVIFDPDANAIYVVPAIAWSVFVFAYSTEFGQIAILGFYALWLAPFLLSPELLAHGFRRVLPLLLLPLLAVLSTLWSDTPATTLRASIQFATTVFCALIVARMCSVPNLVLGGLIGGIFVLLYSYWEGEYAYDFIDGSYAFSGAFGSKNQLGFHASLTIIFALSIIFIFYASTLWRLLAAAIGALAAWTLYLSDSATSVLTLILALVTIMMARGIFALPRQFRSATVLALFCVLLAVVGLALQLGALDAVFEAFGKDTTLTGRTYLWNQGILFGQETPAFGLGYNAFWVHGRPEAEDLWFEFYIGGRSGFHFHNTLIEAYVGLGVLGVALIGAITAALVIMSIRAVSNRSDTGSAAVMAGLALLFVSRSFVEIDFFTPYTVGSLLVPYLLLRMADQYVFERDRSIRTEQYGLMMRSS